MIVFGSEIFVLFRDDRQEIPDSNEVVCSTCNKAIAVRLNIDTENGKLLV
jgi:hypothetical protein